MPPSRALGAPPALHSRPPARAIAAAVGITCALGLAACTPADDPQDETTGEAAPDSSPLVVLASFYPLEFLAEEIGGDAVDVSSMTPPGIDPHDLELSPRQVREVGDADVVVYLSGFQPSVDEAVAARAPEVLLDAAQTAAVAAHMSPSAAVEDDHGDDDHGHDHGEDPHFWLDPTLLAAVGEDLAEQLGAAAPEHAEEFRARAQTLTADLDDLDRSFEEGLASCERRVVVAAHEAYGFLAERYGLEQVGISGLDPEAEPSPARLREIRAVVEANGVTTIFTEDLVNPKVAETLAEDLGITTALLDPLESQVDEQTDYRGAMEQNLAALRGALGCT